VTARSGHERATLGRYALATAAPVAILTLALLVALSAEVGDRALVVRLWLVALGVVAVRAVMTAVAGLPLTPRRSAFDAVARPRPAPPPPPPGGLRDARWLLLLAAGSAADLHYRVRPVLREVAAQRLGANHGIELDDPLHASEAAELCGPALWEVVRPDRPGPVDRNAPGVDPRAVPALVGDLERL